jgi:hypothetical protein
MIRRNMIARLIAKAAGLTLLGSFAAELHERTGWLVFDCVEFACIFALGMVWARFAIDRWERPERAG